MLIVELPMIMEKQTNVQQADNYRFRYTITCIINVLYQIGLNAILGALTILTSHRYCPSLTVPNLLPNKDELTILVCSGDHPWLFLVILAMTMTMTINSNSVLLVSVALAGQYERFEHVQKCRVPSSAEHEYFSFVVMRFENV